MSAHYPADRCGYPGDNPTCGYGEPHDHGFACGEDCSCKLECGEHFEITEGVLSGLSVKCNKPVTHTDDCGLRKPGSLRKPARARCEVCLSRGLCYLPDRCPNPPTRQREEKP